MEACFIVNEQAGNGGGAAVSRQLKRENRFPVLTTEYPGHATELARLAAEQTAGPLLLVVVGGDGTVHEVLNGIIGSDHVTVGLMKAGSGNDFAREFPAFRSISDVETYLQSPDPPRKKADAGFVYLSAKDSRHFASNAGFGLDADISLAASSSRFKKLLNKWKLGRLVYVLTVAGCLFRFKRFKATVQIDDDIRVFENVWMLTVSNQKYYGGGMKISPLSVSDDGKFELTVVHNISLIKFLTVFLTVFTGQHTRFKGVSLYQSEKFIISPDRPVGCHCDGEFIGRTVEGQAVEIIVSEARWTVAGK